MTDRLLLTARVGSVAELFAAVAMFLCFPALLAAALLPHLGLFATVCALSYLSDHYLHRRGSYLLTRLSKVRAGLSHRFLLRQLLLVLLLVRTDAVREPVEVTALACFLVLYGVQAVHGALVALLRNLRRLPVATRNIDLSALRITDAPPQWLIHRAAEKVQHLDLPAVAGLLLAAATGTVAAAFAGMGATMGLAALYCAAVLVLLRISRKMPGTDAVLEWFDAWLRVHRPTTVLYFSGSAESTYQVNMWLETLRELDGRPLVVLRERHTLSGLAATSVPVVCVPSAVHLMNLDLSMVRVALYPANVGKNIHLLRVPTMKHVFIGHGDSDKIASINPYSKVYDEVWTAGRAGRDRYALADVGVRDDAIVEVGRPQLSPIHGGPRPRTDRIPTVLYAPTWEGWTDEPGNTSLILAGANIVRRLLEADRPVRVLYKPHPFTGTRSSRARTAHERIVALLEEAARRRAAEPEWTGRATEAARSFTAARAELDRIEARLEQLTGTAGERADDAEQSRDAFADAAAELETARLRTDWNDAYWRSFGWWEHRVITGAQPQLYDCFNECDAMVSDISSVVSDFVASGKPYAVTDSAGLGASEFRRQNTAVRAAVILGNEARELEGLLRAVEAPEADPLAEDRQQLKVYLLGPDEPASVIRFNAAVTSLGARAAARNAGLGAGGTEPVTVRADSEGMAR